MQPYPACPMRKRITLWAADGTKTKVQRCTEEDSEKYTENVTPEDCLECPLRASLARLDSNHHPYVQMARQQPRGALTADEGGGGYSPCKKRQILTWQSTCSSCSKELTARICNEDKSPHDSPQAT